MTGAEYYGEFESIDYTEYYEWIKAVKEDFRKFKSYILVNYEENENFNKLLESVENNIDNTRPYDKNGPDGIFVGQNYSIISYPVYFDEVSEIWQSEEVIISRDYKLFIFINNPKHKEKEITLFELENGKIIEEKLPYVLTMCWSDESTDKNIKNLRDLRNQ